MPMAEFVTNGTGPTNNPKTIKNSISATHSNRNFQQGGNRLSGAGNPQKRVPSDDNKIASIESAWKAPANQGRIGATGAGANRNPHSSTYNQAKRPLAGSSAAGVSFRNQTDANTLTVQRSSRASARGISGVNTTTTRGGSSQTGRLKTIAGTADTYQLGGGKTTGTTTVKVASQHYIGLHRVMTVHPVQQNVNRVGGGITAGTKPTVSGTPKIHRT